MRKTKKSNKIPTVIVVGAGLAGLAAAYELQMSGQAKVRILEKNSLPGGRVKSFPINGQMTDLGGFIVYPWYKEYLRLVKDIGLKNSLKKLPIKKIYYEWGKKNSYTAEDKLKFPLKESLKIETALLKKMLLRRINVVQPLWKQFGDQTVSQYFSKILGKNSAYERFADIVAQGYCYPSVKDYRMAVLAPIVWQTFWHGDIRRGLFFMGDSALFTRTLAKKITQAGGEIIYNAEVEKITQTTIKTKNKKIYMADKIVFAAAANSRAFSTLLPKVEPCTYTNFLNAVLVFDKEIEMPKISEWGAIFYKPNTKLPYQIVSSVNLSSFLPQVSARYVNVNIVVRQKTKSLMTQKKLLALIKDQTKILFPNATLKKIAIIADWSAMPIATKKFAKGIEKNQGQNNYYFAGDYLGSPSMETAVKTGVRAAKLLLKDIRRA